MTTKKLFWDQPYDREFDAKIIAVNGQRVALDQTLYYPRGGGVASDTGLLSNHRVVEVTKQDDQIWHSLDQDTGLKQGETVHGVIDWERRHRLMRMHTAGHLLSNIFYRENCLITGNQIEPDRARFDFNLEQFDRGKIEGLVNEANTVILKDAPVKMYFVNRDEASRIPGLVKLAEAAPPSEETLRIVEIEGIDRQADGGLHVARLKEIGKVELLKLENKGKNNRRLYYDVKN
ncbi:MAG TPA: alanyl-tRNA editing protein [Candidatus Binatus sp.]|nr:alanyl-tRNA editing protein [Candidatus Binatus sp.]